MPLALTMVLLPLLRMMLNGTSPVLYGTVPEMVAPERTARTCTAPTNHRKHMPNNPSKCVIDGRCRAFTPHVTSHSLAQ
jgi:hypothetical protein